MSVDPFEDLLGVEPADASGLPEAVSTDELASLLGVSTRSVTELARKGIARRAGRGTWAVKESVRAYCDHLREMAAGRANSTSLTAERIRVAREQADALAIKNAVTRGEMVPAREVETAWATIFRDVRAAVLALPSRIHLRLGHLTMHDISEMDREVREALTELSNDPA